MCKQNSSKTKSEVHRFNHEGLNKGNPRVKARKLTNVHFTKREKQLALICATAAWRLWRETRKGVHPLLTKRRCLLLNWDVQSQFGAVLASARNFWWSATSNTKRRSALAIDTAQRPTDSKGRQVSQFACLPSHERFQSATDE